MSGREADAGHDVGRVEGGLLDLGEVVLRVAVQFQHAHLDQRVVLVEPDLGQVEGVVRVAVAASFSGITWMYSFQLREVAVLDGFEQVALVALAVLADERLGLGVGQVLDALLGDAGGT